MTETRAYRGMPLTEVDATDVKVGDKVVCMLSDAVAAVEVTSITERVLDLERHGLGKPVHLVFGYSSAPWWVDQQYMSASKDSRVFIKPREVSS